MKDTIFRQYDIRGKVGQELSIDKVYKLICAVSYFFVHTNPAIKTVVVGMDGRIHGPSIKEHVIQALRDSGLDVLFIGICPTPVVQFALHTQPVDAGIVITASHNPHEYNGFKISIGKEPVWGAQLRTIRDMYKQGIAVTSKHRGTLQEESMIGQYTDFLVAAFCHLKNFSKKVIIDCGNGVAGTVLPELIKKMGWSNVHLLFEQVDGTYPNHEADPTVEENMSVLRDTLLKTRSDLGIGLDGDCDRMAPLTRSGRLVLGDLLLALFARDILKKHPAAGVVFDIKSSASLIEQLKAFGAKPCMSATGHTNIKEQLKITGALLGGELSCHFFFKDRYFGYDDGIYAMLRLFEIVDTDLQTLDQVLESMPKKYSSREYRIACPDEKKELIVSEAIRIFKKQQELEVLTLDGVRVVWPFGWGIVRASNTQPVLSCRFEANSPEELIRVKKLFVAVLSSYIDTATLKRELELSDDNN